MPLEDDRNPQIQWQHADKSRDTDSTYGKTLQQGQRPSHPRLLQRALQLMMRPMKPGNKLKVRHLYCLAGLVALEGQALT